MLLTTGTSGHAVFWPFSSCLHPSPYFNPLPDPPGNLPWTHQTRIHQSTSKVLTSLVLDGDAAPTLLVSGGDDGSLAFVVAAAEKGVETAERNGDVNYMHKPVHPPVIVARVHASAITACVAFTREERIFVVTSGNDQWVRVWEVVYHPISASASDLSSGVSSASGTPNADPLEIRRLQKIKTNVADVSSMTLLAFKQEQGDGNGNGEATRVLICGVGMELIRLDWNALP